MKLRSFFLSLGILVLSALAVAAVSFAWILSQSPLRLSAGGTLATPGATMFVPRQAPLAASLLVNPDRLEALLQLQTPLGDRRRLQREIKAIEAGLLDRTGLNYRRDLRRWLGDEVTFAVTALDFDRDPTNGAQPGYLLALEAANGAQAQEFLQVFWARRALAGAADLEFESYKGTNLIYQRLRETGETPLASAMVGDRYVLVANHPKVLREAINNVQAARLNLANAPAYQQALASVREPRLATIFANLPALAALPPGALPPEPPTLLLALQASERGLVAQAALAGLASAPSVPAVERPVAALNYLPADSSLAIAGRDLQALWAQLQATFPADSPLGQLLARTLASFEEPLGLNLAEDIFAWAQGEYALALRPRAEGASLEWLFAAERSPETAAAIARLDELAEAQDLTAGKLQRGETEVTAWTQLAVVNGQIVADVRGVRASVGNYELLASSLGAMESALAGAAAGEGFRQAFAALPEAKAGYFYLNWPASRLFLERRWPSLRLLEAGAQPLLDRLRSLALVSTGSRDGVGRAAIAFELALEPSASR